MRKLFLLFAAVLLLLGRSFAQDPLIRTDLIPPSPTAGSIARAGEVPFNLSSGLPSLSIPIFNVQGHDLSLPISLNYSYDGFKPAQSSGWIGLGWTLEAGGVITRQVRDKVDGTMSPGYNYDSPSVQSVLYSPLPPSQSFLHDAAGSYDLEPDVYSFNFPGYSGKFIVRNGKAYVFPSQKLKITGGDSGYTITTENGTKYLFEEIEQTSNKGAAGAPYLIPTYNSAWYLSKITNATGTETIRFTYVDEGKVSNPGALTQTYRKNQGLSYDTMPADPSKSYPTKTDSKRLYQIISEKHQVTFGAADDRLDVDQSEGSHLKKLGAISIASTGGMIREFILNSSYTGTNYYSGNALMLNSLKQTPVQFDEVPSMLDTLTHSFEYNGITNVNKTYAAVDHFGFAKGGSFNTMLIPSTLHSFGVDRSPVLGATAQGAMTKIIYPSKGYTSFDYELNDTPTGAGYERDYLAAYASVTRPLGSTGVFSSSYNPTFTITEEQTVQIMVERTPYEEMTDGQTKSQHADFEIVAIGTSTVVASGAIALEANNVGQTFSWTLPAGTYQLKAYADLRDAYVAASLNYYGVSNRMYPGNKSGGLRVVKMTTVPLDGPSLQRAYGYTTPEGISTGMAPSSTYSVMPFKEIAVNSTSIGIETNFDVISSYIAEAPSNALPHFYTSVVEKQISGTDTLFTRHDFKAFIGTGQGVAPKRVIQYRKNGSGQLVPATMKSYSYEEVVDTAFRGIKPYKTMQVVSIAPGGSWGWPMYEYSYDDTETSQSWKYLASTREVVYEGTDSLVTVTNNSYDGKRNLYRSTASASNGDVLVSKFKYPESYASGFSAMLGANVLSPVVEQQRWNRIGMDSVLVSGAVTEYSTSSFRPLKQYMLGAAGISSLNNESKTGALYNNLISDSRYEERARYGYDSHGRLIVQQLTGGIPVSYKWGYASTPCYGCSNAGEMNYPIVEAKNALPTEIYTENFEEHSSATTGAAHSGAKYYSGDFALSWSIPNARAYMVSFFYRSGGKWQYKVQSYMGSTTLTDGDAIDDVAIYPADAQLSSLTYYPGIGNRSAIDAKGNMASYEYDELNRLLNIRDQHGDIIKNYRYNQPSGNLFYSVTKTGNFTKNDCSSGSGSTVSYTIPAGSYSSSVSQAVADALADAALAAGGQANANANGTCAANVAVSYINSSYFPFEGDVYQLQIKDGSGNVLYTFNNAQLVAGFSIPQGTYTLSFTMLGSLTPGNSWGTLMVYSASGYNEVYSTGPTVYNITGVVMTASTATIQLISEIY